jgi:hypothetical protein
MLGGLVFVAIGASVTTRYFTRHLMEQVPMSVVGLIMERTEEIGHLASEVMMKARQTFGSGYNLQMYIATGLAAAQLPTTLLMWTWKDWSKVEPARMGSEEDEGVQLTTRAAE